MSEAVRQRFTFAEYVELESMSPLKHEFIDGQVWAMAGGSPSHAAIAVNISTALATQLRDRPCRVFSSDLRIRVQATGLATYPDVSVVCGDLELDPADPRGHTVTNPALVVEVLSPSTEDYERGEKLAHYKRIPGLLEVLLVAHEEPRLELWRRDGDRWTLEVARGEESLSLTSVPSSITVTDVYRDPLG